MDCIYTIAQPDNTFIEMTILTLELGYKVWAEAEDYLEIRDGGSNESPLLGKFNLGWAGSIRSTKNFLWMRQETAL